MISGGGVSLRGPYVSALKQNPAVPEHHRGTTSREAKLSRVGSTVMQTDDAQGRLFAF